MKAGKLALLLCVVFSHAQSLSIYQFIRSCPIKKPFTIEEAVLGKLVIRSRSGKWTCENEVEFFDRKTGNVKLFDPSKNTTTVIVPGTIFDQYNAKEYGLSPDKKFVLLAFDSQKVFRNSGRTKFVIHSLSDGTNFIYDEYVQAVEWSPKVNNVVFIKDNNIYVIRNVSLSNVDIVQITKNGEPGKVYNGIGDWVYQEEILHSRKSFWFSPEGDQLAYATYFDHSIPKITIEEYGHPLDSQYQYTKQNIFPYPKPGTIMPTYTLSHVSFKDPKNPVVITKWSEGQELFHKLMWKDNKNIVYLVTNRVQNVAKFYTYSTERFKENPMEFMYEINSKGWVNTNLPHISQNDSRYLRIQWGEAGCSGKFKHVLLTYKNKTVFDLTPGPSEVLNIAHWNEEDRLVYYVATENETATATQLYVVREHSETGDQVPVCLSCGIKSPEGRGCKDVYVSFSPNGLFLILSCNGPDPKMIYVFENFPGKPLGEPLLILEDNFKLRRILRKKLMPEVVNMTVDIEGNLKADVRLMLPPNTQRSKRARYPLVVHVYGGPCSKSISDAFKLHWGFYMSTNLNVVYAIIDGRNTVRKGQRMLFAGYKALGTVEIQDQISVTKYLQKTLPFIDPKRTGIWGWSYGGYVTTKVLEVDTQNIFKGGIAVAPVADWLYYDSVYAEKYLGLPEENKEGYENASVLKNLTNLRNKDYLLIHGSADDNVHYQNSMMIAKKLESENIAFDFMTYPDEDHGLINVRKHFYYTMSRFWKRCFSLE